MRWLFIPLVTLLGCAAEEPHASAPSRAPKTVVQGRIVHGSHHSGALGVDKSYVVYLPAGYDDAPAKRWPVFYYLHGITSPETEWVDYGKLDVAADSLGLGTIVVMPDGDDGFYTDSAAPIDYDACMRDGGGLFDRAANRATTCVRRRAYESYVVGDLVSYVDTTYRTLASRDARAIAGLSMGGFGALSLAFRHPDLFAAVASHSGLDALFYAGPHPYASGPVVLDIDPAKWTGPSPRIAAWARMIFGPDLASWRAHDPATLAQTLGPGAPAIYLDCGTEDPLGLADQATYLHEVLAARHVEHSFFLGHGGHDYDFWVRRIPVSLAFLRDHTAAAR